MLLNKKWLEKGLEEEEAGIHWIRIQHQEVCFQYFSFHLLLMCFFSFCYSHILVSSGSLLSLLFVCPNVLLGKPLTWAIQLRYFATAIVKIYVFHLKAFGNGKGREKKF